jgi:hypothetical protein
MYNPTHPVLPDEYIQVQYRINTGSLSYVELPLSYLEHPGESRQNGKGDPSPLDPAFANGLNAPGFFSGVILNRENIGKSSEELVEKWNAEHPEDPIQQMFPAV